MRVFLSCFSWLILVTPVLAQTTLPAGQNVPFRFAGRSVPQLLNGTNGFRFTLPENTVYAAVRLQTITPDVNIQLLVRRGQDVAGTANAPVFGERDQSTSPNKQVQVGLDSALLIGSDQPYFVALRAAESSAPVAGVLRLEVRTMTPGGTRVEFAGFQEILLAGQPDGTRYNSSSAPLNSPPEPITVTPGQGIVFEAVGNALEDQSNRTVGPEGYGPGSGPNGSAFGLSRVSAPPGAVIGVFTGPSIDPNRSNLPLSFEGDLRERLALRPAVQQMFMIGSGFNTSGSPKTFVVPAGATRLYLGRTRTDNRGTGRTLVRVSSVPSVPTEPPANPLRLGGATFIELANQPTGARAGSNGHAPHHNPPQVAISLIPGQLLSFRASGAAGNGYNTSVYGPAGHPTVDSDSSARGNGFSGIETRPGALIGVFLGANLDRNNAPPRIDFGGPVANVTPFRPLLNQIFLIGDGKVADGSDRKVVVPAGALGLYISHARGSEDTAGSFTVAVTAERPDRPNYSKASIVNAASFGAGPISAGSIVSIFGEQLGQQASASAVPLPRTLGGTQVFFDTIPAPLYLVTAGQINAQVPWELGAARSAIVTVVRNGIPGPPTEIDLAPYQPALFTAANIGAILVNSRTGGLVTPQDPARAGDVLIGYATGLGATSADPRTGEPDAGSPLANTASPTRILLTGPGGEREVTPFFAGLAPGFIGVFQLNFALPAGLGAGTARMRLDSAPFGVSPAADVAVGQ